MARRRQSPLYLERTHRCRCRRREWRLLYRLHASGAGQSLATGKLLLLR
ncbi:MAG: hypothetical protein VCF24_11770 [Candidatus Latescibacterota bacterium]